MIRLMLRTQPESGKRVYGQRSLFTRNNLKIIDAKDFVSVREIVIDTKGGEITIQQTGNIPSEPRQPSIAFIEGSIWIGAWIVIHDTKRNWIQ